MKKAHLPIGQEPSLPAQPQMSTPPGQEQQAIQSADSNSPAINKRSRRPKAKRRHHLVNIDWDEVAGILNEKCRAELENATPAKVELANGIKELRQLYLRRPLES